MSEMPSEPAEQKPALGSPESAAFFRAKLAEIGETQSSLARLMKRYGDDRPERNILRSIQRTASGQSRVSGEMRVLLRFMERGRKKRLKREACEE
jgi:hypothetical protein